MLIMRPFVGRSVRGGAGSWCVCLLQPLCRPSCRPGARPLATRCAGLLSRCHASLPRPSTQPLHPARCPPPPAQAHKKAIRRATVNTFGYIAKAIGPQDVLVTLLNNLKVGAYLSQCMVTFPSLLGNWFQDSSRCSTTWRWDLGWWRRKKWLLFPLCFERRLGPSMLVTLFQASVRSGSQRDNTPPHRCRALPAPPPPPQVQERQNRVCTTVAIAIVAETCAPFTVLPALMNEYKVGGVRCAALRCAALWLVALRLIMLRCGWGAGA